MTVEADIRSALNSRLNTLAGGYDIAWENTVYDPVIGTTYLRPTVLPSTTTGSTIGSTAGTDNHSGIYQIDIMSEVGVGAGLSQIIADSIADHFKPITELVYNGRLVRCVSVSVIQAAPDNGWYITPIEIRYLSLTQKR